MSLHSILAPSGHDRWGTCAGALAACKGLPEQRTNEAAALGTAKHAISEYILTSDFPDRGCGSQVGQKISADGFTFTIDDTFADHVDVYVNYVNSRTGQKFYESYVSTAHIFGVPGQGGTIDCKCLDFETSTIEIIDAKFGYVPVGAEHKQLRDYGAAALTLHDLEGEWTHVKCTIVQPQDFAEPIKSKTYTRAEIEAFILEEKPKAQLAFKLYDSPPVDLLRHLTPTETACAWCPIAGSCVARTNRIVNMFKDASAAAPTVILTDERLAELLAEIGGIAEWAAGVYAEANNRALQGRTIPGQKLIYGRKGARAYKPGSEETVKTTLEMTLGDDMYKPREMQSPTQVEALLKKANASALYATIAPFVFQSDPKLKLVPLATKGDAVTVTNVIDAFKVVT